MFKMDSSKYRNPPAPAGMSNEGLTNIGFYKPETNPIVKMISTKKASQSGMQSIVHLLDQFLLQTPPVSEDEEESVKEPMEIVRPVKRKIGEPAAVRSIEMDDSIITNPLFEFIAEEKRKIMSQQKEKKKREGKSDKEEKIKMPHKHSSTNDKTISLRKKSHKSSAEESLIAGNSSSSSPTIVEAFQHSRSDSPSNRSSKHHKSSTVVGRKRHKSPNSDYANDGESDMDPRQERRSGHRSSHRSSRNESSIHRSPSSSPDGRSYNRRRSPVGSSNHSKYGNRSERKHSKHYGSISPDRIQVRTSPSRDKLSYQKSFVHSPFKGSSSRSPDKERLPVRWNEKERLDRSKRTAAAKPEVRSKFKKFVVKDEYSQILAEEMKKRQLLEESDEEPEVIGVLGAPLKKEKTASDEESVPLSEEQENFVKYELGMVNPKEMKSGTIFPQTKFFKQENIKSEFPDKKEAFPNCFYCQTCQLALNSDLTWHSHITGKKHAKMLQLQKVHEIARGSIAMPSTPAFVSEDIPRFANPPAGRKRYPVNELPRLLPAIVGIRDRPVPGLDFIQEIISEMDVNYYCELCDAPCGPSSILPHVLGYKHHLKFLKQIMPDCYERNRQIGLEKRRFGAMLNAKLSMHEKEFGRGRIKVFREEADIMTAPSYDHPGPSWRNTSSIPVLKKEKIEEGEIEIPNNDECLDTSKGDFFCKLCDSHMNNVNMWESHVRGKRHLKNAKKIPGENISKLKSVKVPDARSKLEELVHECAKNELIVGLDFIRETRGINGEIYNCFLCGSCSTNFDIIEHILLPKHRLRYLEKLVTEGKPNDVTTISQMEFQDPWFRQTLVENECREMVKKYGKGKVEVYMSKN